MRGKTPDVSKINPDNPFFKLMMKSFMKKTVNLKQPGLRAPEYKHVRSRRIKIELPDGAKLAAYLTLPDKKQAFPVILVRNPYVSNSFLYESIRLRREDLLSRIALLQTKEMMKCQRMLLTG